jgi:K+-transporting ATPase KdpF subunit
VLILISKELEKRYGRFIFLGNHLFIFSGERWTRRRLRKTDGAKNMNASYLIVGLIALALFAYLFLALLKPEWFK